MTISKNTALVVLLAVVDGTLFTLSGIKRYRYAHGTTDEVIGNILWLGFLLGTLTLVVIGVMALVRTNRRRRSHA